MLYYLITCCILDTRSSGVVTNPEVIIRSSVGQDLHGCDETGKTMSVFSIRTRMYQRTQAETSVEFARETRALCKNYYYCCVDVL